MLNKYRHFYLYAKLNYEHTDIVEDLKKITGNYTGCSPESETIGDILSILTDAMNDLYKRSINSFRLFSHAFLSNMVDYQGIESSSHIVYIRACLNIMHNTEVYNIDGELGEADYNILPCHEWNKTINI